MTMHLEVKIEKISPSCGYTGAEAGKKATSPYVHLKLTKSLFFFFKQDVGHYASKSQKTEQYSETHTFEIDDIGGAEMAVEVWDDHMGDRTASFVGMKQIAGVDRKFMLGSCKIHLDHHKLEAGVAKPIKVPLSNTMKDDTPYLYLILTSR